MRIRIRFGRHKKSLVPAFLLLLFAGSYFLYIQMQKERTMEFSQEIVTNLSLAEAWNQVTQGLQNSEESSFGKNNIVQFSSSRLSEGEALVMKCKLWFLEKVQEYKISALSPGKSIVYETSDKNPLDGRIAIHVVEENGKAKIQWNGEFSYRGFSPMALFLKYYFQDSLFPELQEKLNL